MTETRPFPEPEMSDAELLRLMEERRQLTKRRQQMKKALRAVITPLLRQHGFTGTGPNFCRLGQQHYDLLMIEFNKWEDCFHIEIGQCTPDWYRRERSAFFPPEKLRPWDMPPGQRALIKPRPGRLTADCFQYGDSKISEDYRRVAESIVPFVKRAVEMLDDFEHVEKGNW